MSTRVEHFMECVTVEISVEKNIMINCVCKTPGSCLDTFSDKMVDVYDKVDDKKVVFVCGENFFRNKTLEILNL